MANFSKIEGEMDKEEHQLFLDLNLKQTTTIEQKQLIIDGYREEITKLEAEIEEMSKL